MTRQPRLDLPNVPQPVVQRGNNRLSCFLDDDDRHRYLTLLREALLDAECHLHASVLMDKHVHLLVTPPRKGSVSRMMQKLGHQYSGQLSARHGRTGTMWEGRCWSCLVDTQNYVLRRYRHIDLNPDRARMIDDTAAYAWSRRAAFGGKSPALLKQHPACIAMGTSAPERAQACHPCRTKTSLTT